MPYCINNPKRSYTGKEPSPKGLGYCASGEKEGKKMKGKDGNMWIKSNGKWHISNNICENIVKYVKTKKFRGHAYKTDTYGKEIDNKFYKWISYNEFADKSSQIERGYKKGKVDKKKVNEYICGNKKTAKDLDKKIHNGYKTYLISDNGSRPFLVAVKDKTAKIFKIGKDIATSSFWSDVKDYYYTDLIKEFKCNKIFIPKGYDGVDISNGILKDYKNFRGNSVLLLVKDKYIYIGREIYEFKIGDEIIEYYSPIGNNDVPYPVAIGKENIYFMLDKSYVPIKYFEGLKKIDLIDAYSYYYGYLGEIALGKYSKNLKGIYYK